MITIAVAGGSSAGLGRSILTALKQYPDQLKGVVLGRASSKTPQWLEKMGVEVRKVDYSSVDSLTAALQGVHTVICVLLAKDGTGESSQINLLNAGLRAGISRFAPTEFGCGLLANPRVDILRPRHIVTDACREAQQKHPGFEYACFNVGLFMNYLGYGAPDEEGALNGLNDTWVWVWDVKGMKAAIPLTKEGKVPRMTTTEIGDVGKFVAAACLLPKGSWKEDFGMVGETIHMDEVVKIIESVRGKKMEVTFRPYDQVVEENQKEEIVYPNKFWGQLEEMVARNAVGEGIVNPVLNELCPEVRPMSVEQYVRKFWS
ncbi:NAD(P)-binding protein [Periconia macrospinosa]|uniref:NAD(P)-binding protein n=1 Tax=Periconia macrospinosa TaxID=97972 RepID=A0A2V1D055_9PLEO|nr:NAD(P)-binding protein [Periconia macrospinosa]